MFQVRIHGRGGQGVVTAAELLSVAAFREGRHAQAFPSFGSERTGAPVVAFCRLDTRPIRLREPILEPDALIIQDPTLLHQVDVFGGLRHDGYILINTSRTFEELGLERVRGGLPAGAAPHRAGHGDRAASTSAGRCRTRRCSAALPRRPAADLARVGERRDPREVPGQGGRGQRRRRHGGLCLRHARLREAAHA